MSWKAKLTKMAKDSLKIKSGKSWGEYGDVNTGTPGGSTRYKKHKIKQEKAIARPIVEAEQAKRDAKGTHLIVKRVNPILSFGEKTNPKTGKPFTFEEKFQKEVNWHNKATPEQKLQKYQQNFEQSKGAKIVKVGNKKEAPTNAKSLGTKKITVDGKEFETEDFEMSSELYNDWMSKSNDSVKPDVQQAKHMVSLGKKNMSPVASPTKVDLEIAKNISRQKRHDLSSGASDIPMERRWKKPEEIKILTSEGGQVSNATLASE